MADVGAVIAYSGPWGQLSVEGATVGAALPTADARYAFLRLLLAALGHHRELEVALAGGPTPPRSDSLEILQAAVVRQPGEIARWLGGAGLLHLQAWLPIARAAEALVSKGASPEERALHRRQRDAVLRPFQRHLERKGVYTPAFP